MTEAVVLWKPYLHNKEVTILVDHKPLASLSSQSMLSGKQVRMYRQLESVTTKFTIKYIPGRQNILADTLSRCRTIVLGIGDLKSMLK